MYDVRDHMKFGFSLAFTATVLSWAIIEYGDQRDAVNQLEPAQKSLKWITDYLNCSSFRERALYSGTEVAAETTAAMASTSLVFKTADSTYSRTLLKHAKQLLILQTNIKVFVVGTSQKLQHITIQQDMEMSSYGQQIGETARIPRCSLIE